MDAPQIKLIVYVKDFIGIHVNMHTRMPRNPVLAAVPFDRFLPRSVDDGKGHPYRWLTAEATNMDGSSPVLTTRTITIDRWLNKFIDYCLATRIDLLRPTTCVGTSTPHPPPPRAPIP